ncbi:MAG: hypothetical protein M3096_03880 [Actinomycetia bacterium]|nr:hypothetical protein [Actinomycetes bacterium]
MSAAGVGSNAIDIRRGERLSHALYGLIIVTATLVAEKEHVDEASHALAVIIGTGAILFLAHTYSGIVAERVVASARLGSARRRLVARDNLPVLFAIIVPAALFTLVWMGPIALEGAYVASIAFSLMALFGLGLYEGRIESMNWGLSLLSGIGAATIGVLVIAFETFLD